MTATTTTGAQEREGGAAGGDAGPRQPVEIELKFRMTDAATGDRLLAADDLAGFAAEGPAESVVEDDRYVDTADGVLAAGGFAARLRTHGDDTIISLKGRRADGENGAVHRRQELEGPADRTEGPREWPASEARTTVLELAGDAALEELVTLRQIRRKRSYRRDDAVVELSLDQVEVIAGERVVDRFAELELELRKGDEEALAPLADLLADVEELVPVETSKLERALEALRRDADQGEAEPAPRPAHAASRPIDAVDHAVEAGAVAKDKGGKKGDQPAAEPAAGPFRVPVGKTPGVLAEDHLAEAGRKVLKFHLARMIAREPGTRDGGDTEELHGMRVATRRQRAAWRVFGESFDQKRTSRHQRRLKAVARDLGAVRDLDVLIDGAEAYRDNLPKEEAAAFDHLIAGWRFRREAAREVLIRELDSERYRQWVEDYVGFVQAEGHGVLPVGPTEPHRVRDTMPSRIWSAYETVRGYEPVLRWADVATLHDLRIAAKWLRYTLEFVREALGREAGPAIERVVALQDHLGWLHDADVAAGLARQYLVEHAGDLSEAESAVIGRYLVDRERELARLRRTVNGPWRGVAGVQFRRSIGRLVAGL